MTDVNEMIKAETARKYVEISRQYGESVDRVKAEQERQATLSASAQQCFATANLFGFDLLVEVARIQSPAAAAQPKPPVSVALEFRASIKASVAKFVEDSWPQTVRAAEIKADLESRGIRLHEKTIGMTLYRLSKEGVVKRKGRADWYFVLPPKTAPEETKEPPGDQPGALQQAFNGGGHGDADA